VNRPYGNRETAVAATILGRATTLAYKIFEYQRPTRKTFYGDRITANGSTVYAYRVCSRTVLAVKRVTFNRTPPLPPPPPTDPPPPPARRPPRPPRAPVGPPGGPPGRSRRPWPVAAGGR